MHVKRKPDQWMQYPAGPQTMTPQQYYVQPPNPHTMMMMQRQHSAPALPQNGYDMHPAFRPNGIGTMGHSVGVFLSFLIVESSHHFNFFILSNSLLVIKNG